jgi:hypothetical protein
MKKLLILFMFLLSFTCFSDVLKYKYNDPVNIKELDLDAKFYECNNVGVVIDYDITRKAVYNKKGVYIKSIIDYVEYKVVIKNCDKVYWYEEKDLDYWTDK